MKIFSLVFFALLLWPPQAIAQTSPPKGAVLTWHNDNLRTGWQQQETILTTSTIGSLGISHSVGLADQVDAQPLVIPGFLGGHDIAFVADESNNVYQIDANTGAIVKQVSLGAPVPRPFKCGNGGPNVGINSTPVIDWASQTLFVMADVNVKNATPTYFLHALNLTTLNDKVPPFLVQASHTLTNGVVVSFDATYQRERAALLFANGKVYSAFTSYCDFQGTHTGGWLLGWTWNGTTLTALPANQLNDRQPSPDFFLDTIWMSGAGPASDESGNLLFATGNSLSSTWTDTAPCSGTATGSVPTTVPCSNIQESVVKLKGDLTQVTGLFSPNAQYGIFSPTTDQLDQGDRDLGAGGVLLVPQRGSAFFAAIAGKDGRLFLFDRSGAGLKLLQLHQGGKCFCAPSYFTGPDGVARIVTSQGQFIQNFKIPTTNLSPEGSATVSTGQDNGFFTTVSCHGSGAFGNCANTPIIWAVSRPTSTTSGVDLSAFSGLAASKSFTAYQPLFGPVNVGPWPNIGGNSNIVPIVSNGRVYVASWKTLAILSPGGTVAAAAPLAEAAAPAAAAVSPNTDFVISGTLHSVNGSVLTFTNRHGKERLIDASGAIKKAQIAPALRVGEAYTAVGLTLTSTDELHADAIYRAKCRQHKEAGGDLTAQSACTADQWPPDKDPGQ